jgi:hypothetical protein
VSLTLAGPSSRLLSDSAEATSRWLAFARGGCVGASAPARDKSRGGIHASLSLVSRQPRDLGAGSCLRVGTQIPNKQEKKKMRCVPLSLSAPLIRCQRSTDTLPIVFFACHPRDDENHGCREFFFFFLGFFDLPARPCFFWHAAARKHALMGRAHRRVDMRKASGALHAHERQETSRSRAACIHTDGSCREQSEATSSAQEKIWRRVHGREDRSERHCCCVRHLSSSGRVSREPTIRARQSLPRPPPAFNPIIISIWCSLARAPLIIKRFVPIAPAAPSCRYLSFVSLCLLVCFLVSVRVCARAPVLFLADAHSQFAPACRP